MALTAIVIGAGWAGEGHTLALRAAGVEVVALCGRTPAPAQALAERLDIPQVHLDWRAALADLQPDIVAVATPAAPHRVMVEAAASLGSHVLCEKPLAVNSLEARAMLAAVTRAGVKTAYAAASYHAPVISYARGLLADGLIGRVHSLESIAHIHLHPRLKFSWLHQLNLGGGTLNNLFTHKLAQVLRLTGGQVLAATGEARPLIDRAPVGPPVHDFRELFTAGAIVDEAEALAGEWRSVDADYTYTVLLRLALPSGQPAGAMFHCAGMSPSSDPDYLSVHGTDGTLRLTGPNAPDYLQHYDQQRGAWEYLPVPLAVLAAHPQVEDPVQRDWNQLAREFVADIRGEGDAGYLTFRDGWIACEIMDLVRAGRGWGEVPTA